MASLRRMARGPSDRSRINIDEEFEVRYWCRELDVPPHDLRVVVNRVGPVVDDVKEELARLGAYGFIGSGSSGSDERHR